MVLYEMVTGHLPFEAEYEQAILYGIVNEEPEPPTALRSGLPVELDRILAKALAKIPAERYQHVDELLVDLRNLQKLETAAASTHARQPAPVGAARGSRWWLAAVFAALLVVFVWLLRPGGEDASHAPLPEPVPLTAYPGQETQPDFSPDGNRVVFVWNGESENNRDIYVKLVGEATTQRLTSDPAPDTSPVWSPDGRFVAFVRIGIESAQLILVPSIGGPERVVMTLNDSGDIEQAASTGNFGLNRLAWCPDSKHMVVVDREGPGEPRALFRISIDGGEKRRLTLPPAAAAGDYSPAVSPSGRQLVFERLINVREAAVFLMNLSDAFEGAGEPRKLSGDEVATSPTWSADGNEIIFTSGIPIERPHLRRVDANGGTSQPIAVATAGSEPAVSPSGNRLVYVRSEANDDIWRANLPDGSSPEPLIRSTYRDLTPQYSPDGQRIAFSSGRSGYREIWVCDSDGSNPVRLTDLKFVGTSGPYWSPEGKEIVFQTTVGNQREIFVVSANGGTPRRLTDNPALDGQPSWSRDGKWIFFWSDRDQEARIWKAPALGGEPTAVTEGTYAVESHDGLYLYVARTPLSGEQVNSVWKVSSEGGEAVKIIDAYNPQGLDLTATPDSLFFLPPGPDPQGRWWVWRLSFASGRAERAWELPGWAGIGLSASPDGKSILFVHVAESASDLMLVDDFR